MTEPQLGGTYDDLLAMARWAESVGMVSFARSDHYGWIDDEWRDGTDAFATLAGLARDTSSIRLAVLVSPITFRHPAVIAKNAATIDQMSHGRFDLGVGTGWMEAEHERFGLPFWDRPERFARLEETLAYLEAAFGDGHQEFTGRYYRLAGDIRPKPDGLRILIGGSGPAKTPALAGRHADEYNHFVTDPATLAPKIDVMRRAAAEAGRDPDTIAVTVMGPILAAPDRTSLDELLGTEAAPRGIDPSEMEQRLRAAGGVYGTTDEVGARLEGLAKTGVERFYLQWMNPTDLAGLQNRWAAIPAP
jgi:alkanesulfonate monooxygenase SsuD/methylene tetrahydromethanopterin reductase-like flavin-dependent oxidoreductase (luciferase family)